MREIFRHSADTALTRDELRDYIKKNDEYTRREYSKLWKAYCNDYAIYHQQRKPLWKPDNRLSVNLARYITETFEGFFMGNPLKVTSDDKEVSEYANFLDSYNDQDNSNAELSRLASIFGRAYEMYYVDEAGENTTAFLDPRDAFMIYDEGIKPEPLYFVRTYTDSEGVRRGSYSDAVNVYHFHFSPDLVMDGDESPHGYDGVPATEYVLNESRRGIFEDVLPLINAYNKALSEKANDIDYFADAYLKVLGASIDEETVAYIRSNRTINFDGDANAIDVGFLGKPDGDTSQEHLLDRMKQDIFQTAMVCNISDENFATSSGIALRYKLMPMENLLHTKERKFISSMNRRYKLLFSNPVSGMNPEDWIKIKIKLTPAIPANLADEAQTASQLSGIVSQKTQLSMISAVEDVDAELDQIKKEETDDYETDRTDTDTDEDSNKD